MKSLILAILILAISAIAHAQAPPPPTTPEDTPRMDIAAIKKAVGKFKNGRRYVVKYDKFDDVTNITFGGFGMSGSMEYVIGGFMLMMGLHTQFKGNGIHNDPPTEYVLFFEATGQGWSFLRNSRLKAIIGDERLDFGEPAEKDSKIGRDILGLKLQTQEWMAFLVTAKDLDRLAQGKNPELRLGTYVMKIKPEHQQMFKDVLSLATVP